MKLATIRLGREEVCCLLTEAGALPLEQVNKEWDKSLLDLITDERLAVIQAWSTSGYQAERYELIPFPEISYAPLYRNPGAIWGIGMNYVAMRKELGGKLESDPIFFMKPRSSMIGPDETIAIPPQSKKTTGEAELAIIIGKKGKNISVEESQLYIAGYTQALDMTAADIHAENPRFMQRAKSFDTFFSFGPELITVNDLSQMEDYSVATVVNGVEQHKNTVKNMILSPAEIISYLSKITTLLPGDIIMTGTPGAAVLSEAKLIECRIDGFRPLVNGVSRS
ncbi:fumarylacetoacetate hydrolase family protein [Bacillus suaedae]|uniref:Fumarylacetoacetate hydrolase family protein n=1 Tax=Halalkalibacter suaedae TaxID=2822140 RepID=A0A940WUB8_9BACI|nr:fumarylacetoacetate hydrolase family protein [Bacillus suaedae]MBP3952441.1 fumarylacetoacetate hydrolase family protein [Bacillus suaedae]